MNNIATFLRESRTARFLIPLGFILIVFSAILLYVQDKNKNYIPIEAEVSKVELVEEAHNDVDGNYINDTYKVFVKYTVNNKEYEEELGELSGYKVGDKVKITYNPDNPSQISQPSSVVLALSLLIAGIASLVGGVISIIIAVKKHKEMKKQEEGWTNGK